jgi:hypothetical protein
MRAILSIAGQDSGRVLERAGWREIGDRHVLAASVGHRTDSQEDRSMVDQQGSDGSRESNGDEQLRRLMDDPAALAWLDEHASAMRRDVAGQGILWRVLVAGFVIGLIAYVAAYLIRATAPGEPLGLLADMCYAFGYSLWTGAVIVVFVQLIPEAKRRQFRQTLELYDARRAQQRDQER